MNYSVPFLFNELFCLFLFPPAPLCTSVMSSSRVWTSKRPIASKVLLRHLPVNITYDILVSQLKEWNLHDHSVNITVSFHDVPIMDNGVSNSNVKDASSSSSSRRAYLNYKGCSASRIASSFLQWTNWASDLQKNQKESHVELDNHPVLFFPIQVLYAPYQKMGKHVAKKNDPKLCGSWETSSDFQAFMENKINAKTCLNLPSHEGKEEKKPVALVQYLLEKRALKKTNASNSSSSRGGLLKGLKKPRRYGKKLDFI